MELKKGVVVQIDPEHDERFGGCFMVVTEIKSWGVVGYCSTPGQKGLAYYRCPHFKYHIVGVAEWVNGSDFEEQTND